MDHTFPGAWICLWMAEFFLQPKSYIIALVFIQVYVPFSYITHLITHDGQNIKRWNIEIFLKQTVYRLNEAGVSSGKLVICCSIIVTAVELITCFRLGCRSPTKRKQRNILQLQTIQFSTLLPLFKTVVVKIIHFCKVTLRFEIFFP